MASGAASSVPLDIGLQADGIGLPKQPKQQRRRQNPKASAQEEQEREEQEGQEQQPMRRRRKVAPKRRAQPPEPSELEGQQEEQQEKVQEQEQEQQPTRRRRKSAPKRRAQPPEHSEQEGQQERPDVQASSSAAAGEGEPRIDRRRLPKSPETRRKMSEARKATLERLGGFSPEWRTALSDAASRRRWGLDVRYRISVSQRSSAPEARASRSAGQRRRWERERAQCKAGSASRLLPSSSAALAQAQAVNEGLARERAVIELSRLRRELAAWLPEFEAQYGRVSVAEMERVNPEMYAKYVRFTNLRNAIREWGSSGQT